MARAPGSRVSATRILADLRAAARQGDRAALTVAIDQMKTLALSPRYWERYLLLLENPLARLVDLLVIKRGERIAHQRAWTQARAPRRPRAQKAARRPSRPRATRPDDGGEPLLFDLR